MATVLDMIELYRAMTALLKPLESPFGRAWQSIWYGGSPEERAVIPDFFGEFASRANGGIGGGRSFAGGFGKIGAHGISADFLGVFTKRINSGNFAAPRLAAGYNGFGAFDKADRLPYGGFYYTGFGDKGAFGLTGRTGRSGRSGRTGRSGRSGRTGRSGHFGEWGLNFFPEKIRGGNDGSYSKGGFVLPDYGADLGMVLNDQSTGRRISGIGADLGYSGYFDFSGEYGEYGEYCDPGASGENRGSLYMNRTLRADRLNRTFRTDRTNRALFLSEDPENVLVPNARSEAFDLWKNTEHLRIMDHLKINGDIASGERLAAVRGFAGREISDFGGYCDSKINIDMSSVKNIVGGKSDMDELIDRLCGAVSEAAFSMAEGVHS